MAELSAGWRWPINARKAHYFDEGTLISICGKWMYAGPSQGDSFSRSSDDCAACRRKVSAQVRVLDALFRSPEEEKR